VRLTPGTHRARLRDIAYHLPETVVSNEMLAGERPDWDMAAVGDRSGVQQRRIAAPGETALDLAVVACRALVARSDLDLSAVDALLFCTQSPDLVMPANSHLLHAELGLGDEVLAFDYNLACSGYVYGVALVQSLIFSGMASEVLLVTADTYSRFIHPGDRSARVLFGDGAAVTWFSATADPGGVRDVRLSSHGSGQASFHIPAGGQRTPKSAETAVEATDRSGNVRTPEHIHMDGLKVWSFINSVAPKQILGLLADNGLGLDDVDQFVFHQASRLTLDSLVKALGVDPAKVFVNLARVGNTVSASIPIALRDALDQGAARQGDLVLLSGFGVGLSYGTVLLKLN
jgi:3-oxoacyl-[acyl-carrier-protein] synthase-3